MPEQYLYANKKTEPPKLNVWCAFPAVYNFAMSSLGYLSIFKQTDTIQGINAERIYTDTKETKINHKNIDIISFSFSYELDFLGILSILDKYHIPFLSKDRDETFPIIYGGGPVLSANPEPYAEIFDFIMIGDAEPYIKEIFEILKENKDKTKQKKLELLASIEGIYIPKFKTQEGYKVKKASADLKECTSTPILTDKSFFSDTYIIEVERGCNRQCAFCLTTYLNTPVRFCPYEKIISKIDEGIKYTNKIALLGALVCAHPKIDDISEYIINKTSTKQPLEVSVSSLRADYVSDKTLEMLHKCGQKTATIAIEAGSERLRRVINKQLTEEEILNAIEKIVSYGFQGLKIYGMSGLPTETYDDLNAFISFCKKIKTMYKGFNLTPSFSSFIAKAHTPFQFAPRENIKSLEKKNEYLKKEFAKIGIKVRTGSAKWDYIQAFLSRGGRYLTPYLIEVYKSGGNLGSFKNIQKTMENQKLIPNLDIISEHEIQTDTALPWDFIEQSKSKEFLKREYKRLII